MTNKESNGETSENINRDYNKLDHGKTRPAASLPPAENTVMEANQAYATPLLDDYSTISDVLAASSKAAENSEATELPGYEEVKKTPVLTTNSQAAGNAESEMPGYEEVKKSIKPVENTEQESATTEVRGLGNSSGNAGNEIPLYSEVNLDLKKSIEALNNMERDEIGNTGDADAAMPLYSEVNKELKLSRPALNESNDNEGAKSKSDDIDEPVLLESFIPEIPLYSSVNMEFKKSKEALDITKSEGNEVIIDIIPLDSVLDDIAKLAEEFPVIDSPPPVPFQPDFEMLTKTNTKEV